MSLDIQERHLLRLGYGEKELDTEKVGGGVIGCSRLDFAVHWLYIIGCGVLLVALGLDLLYIGYVIGCEVVYCTVLVNVYGLRKYWLEFLLSY